MKNRGHVLFLVFAIFTVLLVLSVYAYMYRLVDISEKEVAAAKIEAGLSAQSKSRDEELTKVYEASRDKWSRLPEFFLTSEGVVGFIEALEALGPAVGGKVTISAIGADDIDPVKPNKETYVRAHLASVGSWQDMIKILALAENLPFMISINNVRLDQSDSADGLSVKDEGKKTADHWSMSFDIQARLMNPGTKK